MIEPPPSPNEVAAHADAVFDALVDEGRAMQRLKDVLEAQREAVADNNRIAIEESVRSIGRILLVLDEARRRRQTLVEHLTGHSGVPLPQLEAAFDEPLPARVRDAFQAVIEAGVNLRREVAVNKHIIDRTLQLGDQFLQRLFTERDTAPLYDTDSGNGRTAGAVMFDGQA